MPRIAVCLNYADIDKPHFSGENEYLDYCNGCYAAPLPKEVSDGAVHDN
jgi:hypothetical protein